MTYHARSNSIAKKEPAFTVFRAIVVTMSQPEGDMASKWKLKAPCLPNSQNNDNTVR